MSTYLTNEDLNSFIKAYNTCINEDKTSFKFKDAEVLKDYAYYLIQYANSKLDIGTFNDDKSFKTKN